MLPSAVAGVVDYALYPTTFYLALIRPTFEFFGLLYVHLIRESLALMKMAVSFRCSVPSSNSFLQVHMFVLGDESAEWLFPTSQELLVNIFFLSVSCLRLVTMFWYRIRRLVT